MYSIIVSNYFGFGLMNAEQMVTRARNRTLVGPQLTCDTGTVYPYS